jgi:hypothetical protein
LGRLPRIKLAEIVCGLLRKQPAVVDLARVDV